MKVVDKRRETDEWHVGDVICYYNKPDDKNYGMIMAYECDEDIDAESCTRQGLRGLENE